MVARPAPPAPRLEYTHDPDSRYTVSVFKANVEFSLVTFSGEDKT